MFLCRKVKKFLLQIKGFRKLNQQNYRKIDILFTVHGGKLFRDYLKIPINTHL